MKRTFGMSCKYIGYQCTASCIGTGTSSWALCGEGEGEETEPEWLDWAPPLGALILPMLVGTE